MIGILIVAHGTLGESLVQCASHVVGSRPPLLKQIGVSLHDDPVALVQLAQDLIAQLDQGEGVLILSDIYGATPCNLLCRLLIPGKVEGISGVNLPMLVRALTYRNESLVALVDKALSGGREGVVHVTNEVCNVAAHG